MKNWVLVVTSLIIMTIASYFGNHYTIEGYVSTISNEVIELTDNSGEIWEIDYEEGYKKDDKVKITFFDCENLDRKDDVITKVRKIK